MITQTRAIRQTLDNTAQWKIYYSSNGYVLQNRYTGYYLNMSMDSATEYGVHFASTVGSIAKWSVDYAYVPSGIALYDTENFAWVDTTTSIILNVGAAWKPVCMPIDTHTGSFTVSSDSLVGYSSGTGLITGVTCGDYTSTRITHSCGNTTSTFSAKVILPLSGYEAAYEPARWNTNIICRDATNCYAYALNRQAEYNDDTIDGGGPVQPGYYAGEEIGTTFTGEDVKTAVLADGEALELNFSVVGREEVCPVGTYKVALYMATKENDANSTVDYHFYRQNPDGTWSHKTQNVPVSCSDASGNTIWDPAAANHNYGTDRNYNDPVCYLAITPLNIIVN